MRHLPHDQKTDCVVGMDEGTKIRLHHAPDGTPYARPYLGTDAATGKAIRPYREFPGMTDEEATEAARAWVTGLLRERQGIYKDVGHALTAYVEQMEATGHPNNTIRTYRRFTQSYAAPIARKPIGAVTTTELDDLFRGLVKRGARGGVPLSQGTVKTFRAFLRGAWQHWVSSGAAEHNPVADTMPIRSPRHEAQPIWEGDLEKLVEALRHDLADEDASMLSRSLAMGHLLALGTGMRVGEVCAVRMKDVLNGCTSVRVSGTVTEAGGEAVRQPHTKGRHARTVTLDEGTAHALRGHVAALRHHLGTCGPNTPIVTGSGDYTRPNTLSTRYTRYRLALGLEAGTTFHSLRHTHATLLLRAGIDARTVQERLGHADVNTTLSIYAHVMPGRDGEAAAAFGKAI